MCQVFHDISNMVNNYQRRFLIDHANMQSYDLQRTLINVRGLFGQMDDPEDPFPYHPAVRDSILDQLTELQFSSRYDLDGLIYDIYDCMYIQMFEFLRRYGIRHHWFPLESDDSTAETIESPAAVADFPFSESQEDDVSTITSADEMFLTANVDYNN